MTSTPQPVGGHDVGTQIAQGLAPLGDIVVALNVSNARLTQIHQTLRMGSLGQQMVPGQGGWRPAVQPAPAPPTPVPPGPSAPPGPTGTPTPVPGSPAPAGGGGGPSGPAPGGGGSGGGSGSPSGGRQPSFAQQFAQQPGGGSGLFDRLYSKTIGVAPFMSIPGSLRNEYQSQINKNNFYNSITGAEGQDEAFGMRIEEEMNRARYMRLFNKEEFQQAHRGLASMGINTREDSGVAGRPDYRESMDFIYQAKERYGASVDESLSLVATAAVTASSDLSALNVQLDALSVAAGDAGVSASKARENFAKAWAINTQAGMTGAAGSQWAMASTVANTLAGPQFANDSTASRLATDSGYQAMMAAQMGVAPGTLTSMQQTDPAQAAAAQSGTFIEYMRRYIQPVNPEGWAWLEEECSTAGRDPGTIAEDYIRFHNNDPRPESAMVSYANVFRASAGQYSSMLEVIRYLAKEMMGLSAAAVLQEGQDQAGTVDSEGKTASGKTALDYGLGDLDKDEGGVKNAIASVVGMGMFGAKTKKALGVADDAGAATQTYMDQSEASGERVAVLDKMLKTMTGAQEDSQKVEVETEGGKRVVSLAEAMKEFPDQLATGRARFVGGKWAGKDVGAFNKGVTASGDEEIAAGAAEESGKSSKTGQTAEEYYKEHPDEKFEAAGTRKKGAKYQIDLSPQAAKYFRIIGEDDADAMGEPKDNNNGIGGAASGALDMATFGASRLIRDIF